MPFALMSNLPKTRRNGRRAALVAHGKPVVREGITKWCDEADVAGLTVPSSRSALLGAIRDGQADWVIVELLFGGSPIASLVKEMKALRPDLRVVAVADEPDSALIQRAFRAGVDAAFCLGDSKEDFLDVIGGLEQGSQRATKKIYESVFSKTVRSGKAALGPEGILSDRELDILFHLGSGASAKAIADKLKISPRTVDSHKDHIKAKLKVKSMRELTARAALWVQELKGRTGRAVNGYGDGSLDALN